MNEVSAHDPPPSDAVVERAPPHKRRMAGGLLSGALLCVGIGGLATMPSDALSFFMHRLVQPISAFNLPDVDRWIRLMHNHVSLIAGDARPTAHRDGPVEAGVSPVASAAAETPEITSAERRAFTTATDQPPEPAAIASSEAATEPKQLAPIAEVRQVIARTPPASSAGPSASSADAAAMVARGDAFVAARDIISARLFYERAIELGDGHAALRMGATFDPTFLQRTDIRGAKGDQQEALVWYRRARDLGDVEADRLLKNLER